MIILREATEYGGRVNTATSRKTQGRKTQGRAGTRP